MFFSLIMLIYLILTKPFELKLINNIEIFNEITFIIASYSFFFFLNENIEEHIKVMIGWLLISLSVINTFLNVLIVIWSTIKDTKTYLISKVLSFLQKK